MEDEGSEKKAQTKKLHNSDHEVTVDTYGHCELPAGMTSVPDNAFAHWDGKGKGCKAMESLGIPSSVTAIGDAAFAKCSSLTRLSIPASVAEIEEGAFARCTSLLAVTVPAGATVRYRAFEDTTTVTIA